MEASLSCTGHIYPPSDRERKAALLDSLHGQDEVYAAAVQWEYRGMPWKVVCRHRVWVEQDRQDQSLGRAYLMSFIGFPFSNQRATELAREKTV